MPPVITERDLAAACQETLRPQGAEPDSDWDVAFVLAGGELHRPRRARSLRFPCTLLG